MAYLADLHIHSRFSRACSTEITVHNLAKWAKIKGIDLLGTGDFLHPLWQAEMKQNLKEVGNGFPECDGVKFLFTTEISCIYSDKGKTRRIHLVLALPSFEKVLELSKELGGKGVKMTSDGRPITGLSAQNICEIVLGVEPLALIIPAHIWTPWFSLYGANSGYDSLKDCFGKFSDQIFAVETGESSDPAMNWRIGDLDNKSLLSFSDSHSLPNIGREATLFDGRPSFLELRNNIINQNIAGTIEFFPQEGMYHYSGHRNCGVCFGPKELTERGKICPKCGRSLTVGVMQRVEDLATRSEDELDVVVEDGVTRTKAYPKRPGFRNLIQLRKIIADAFSIGDKSQKVTREVDKLIENLGPELLILTKTPIEEIQKISGEKVAEGVERVRLGKVKIKPGFDGTYGNIGIWDKEVRGEKDQLVLF